MTLPRSYNLVMVNSYILSPVVHVLVCLGFYTFFPEKSDALNNSLKIPAGLNFKSSNCQSFQGYTVTALSCSLEGLHLDICKLGFV